MWPLPGLPDSPYPPGVGGSPSILFSPQPKWSFQNLHLKPSIPGLKPSMAPHCPGSILTPCLALRAFHTQPHRTALIPTSKFSPVVPNLPPPLPAQCSCHPRLSEHPSGRGGLGHRAWHFLTCKSPSAHQDTALETRASSLPRIAKRTPAASPPSTQGSARHLLTSFLSPVTVRDELVCLLLA